MKKIRKKPKKKTFIRAYKSVDRQSDPTCVEIHIFFVPNLRFQMRLRTRWFVENVTQSTRILRRPKNLFLIIIIIMITKAIFKTVTFPNKKNNLFTTIIQNFTIGSLYCLRRYGVLLIDPIIHLMYRY